LEKDKMAYLGYGVWQFQNLLLVLVENYADFEKNSQQFCQDVGQWMENN